MGIVEWLWVFVILLFLINSVALSEKVSEYIQSKLALNILFIITSISMVIVVFLAFVLGLVYESTPALKMVLLMDFILAIIFLVFRKSISSAPRIIKGLFIILINIASVIIILFD